MDDSYKAEWYDIDDADRAAFLGWLHERHLPTIQSQLGILWVGHYAIQEKPGYKIPNAVGLSRMETDDPTVPTGSQYVLLTAAASPDVFFDPNNPPSDDNATRDWLAKRRNYRQAIFLVEQRVNGPEYRKLLPGTGAPPAMQLGNFNVKTIEDEFDLGIFYRRCRYAEIPVTPGCISMLKLLGIAGWPKHGVLYQFAEMDDREEEFEQRFRDSIGGRDWRGRDVREYVVHAPKAPHAGKRIWPAA